MFVVQNKFIRLASIKMKRSKVRAIFIILKNKQKGYKLTFEGFNKNLVSKTLFFSNIHSNIFIELF